jgi:hypothetical protein
MSNTTRLLPFPNKSAEPNVCFISEGAFQSAYFTADYSDVFDPPIPVTISPTLGAREFDEIKL